MRTQRRRACAEKKKRRGNVRGSLAPESEFEEWHDAETATDVDACSVSEQQSSLTTIHVSPQLPHTSVLMSKLSLEEKEQEDDDDDDDDDDTVETTITTGIEKKNWNKEELADVYLDTIWLCSPGGMFAHLQKGRFVRCKANTDLVHRHPISTCSSSSNTSKYESSNDVHCNPSMKTKTTKVSVVNSDTLTAARRYRHPCVLIMASTHKRGGGADYGMPAQEECIYRATNHFALVPKRMSREIIEHPNGMYADLVWIIKDEDYNVLVEPHPASFITVPMLQHPRLLPNGKYSKTDRQMARMIVEHVFAIAYEHHHSVLVLGAFGCGVYGNPPEEMIAIFNEVILKYAGCFDEIVFAIKSSTRERNQNFELFDQGILRL